MNFMKIFLLIVNIILFICSIGFMLLGLVDQIFGPAKVEQVLKKFNIPLSYGWLMIIGVACIVVAAWLHIVRRKWFDA